MNNSNPGTKDLKKIVIKEFSIILQFMYNYKKSKKG